MKKLNSYAKSRKLISVCGSIPIEIPILWPSAVMVGPRLRVLLTLPLLLVIFWVSLLPKQIGSFFSLSTVLVKFFSTSIRPFHSLLCYSYSIRPFHSHGTPWNLTPTFHSVIVSSVLVLYTSFYIMSSLGTFASPNNRGRMRFISFASSNCQNFTFTSASFLSIAFRM
jgi:hypothetical protein